MANVDHNTAGTTSFTRVLTDENSQPTNYGDNELQPRSAKIKTVVLTDAQIKALFTTPVVLVPAPAAGHFLVLHDIIFNYTFNTAAYTNGGGGDVQVQYDTGGVDVVTAASITPLFTAGASAVNRLTALATAIVTGKALVIQKATANLAAGNANATMAVTVFYDTV